MVSLHLDIRIRVWNHCFVRLRLVQAIQARPRMSQLANASNRPQQDRALAEIHGHLPNCLRYLHFTASLWTYVGNGAPR